VELMFASRRLLRPDGAQRTDARGVSPGWRRGGPYIDGGWEVDIGGVLPDGAVSRERRNSTDPLEERRTAVGRPALLVHGKRINEVGVETETTACSVTFPV
jgi:hypothetical protein